LRARHIIAWASAAIAAAVSVLALFQEVDGSNIVLSLVPGAFAVAGALVTTRQPGNIIGWLMLTIGVGSAVLGIVGEYLLSFETAPPIPMPLLFLLLWLSGAAWLVLIYPIFHMLLVFPDGNLVSPRWRWLVALELLMISVFLGATAFAERLGPIEAVSDTYAWSIDNPIGFLSEETVNGLFGGVWSLGLITLAIGGLVSMVVRFRRASMQQRLQIKWLLYAFGLFAAVYAFTASSSGEMIVAGGLLDVLFGVSILGIPVAMTTAILRYRLFDIDLIIRRTLLYVVVTGLLGVVYVGSVFLIRSLLGGVADSSLGVAASTLLVAALFNPLRRRMQRLVDRRLFRTRYDVEQVMENVALSLWDQADVDALSRTLIDAVRRTMQPESAAVWVKYPIGEAPSTTGLVSMSTAEAS
jgi:hypothetical protein